MTLRWCAVRCVVLATLIWAMTSPATQSLAQDAVTDEAIDNAVDRAVAWMWTQQEPTGLWPYKQAPDAKGVMRSITGSRWPPGEHTMAMLALEYANTPTDDKRFQLGLKVLLELELTHNYMISCRVVMLAHLYHRAVKDKKPGLRQAMKRDVDQLVANQGKIGGWRYGGPPIPPRTIDFSNTQLVVLALSEAAKCGVEVPQEAMYRAHLRIVEDQKEDGGWNYGCYGGADVPNRGRDEASYGNMTAACVASLHLTNEFLTGGFGCPCRGGRSKRGKDIVGDTLVKGMAWLNKEFLPNSSPKGYHYYYWIYQAERVGIATGYRYFGEHDWYREIATHLLTLQAGDGRFGRNVVDTSFAILFLVKGRGTILYNKLEHGGNWNPHVYDLPNLVKHIGRAKEQNILWQVLQPTTPSHLWHDAPILYIIAEQPIEMTDELKQKLRRYTDTGGTLLLEASCGNPGARTFWKTLVKELWPEWELSRVDRDHPLWKADIDMRGRKPRLEHLNDGIRSIIFYSATDISCTWHTSAVTRNRAVFDLGTNLPAYAGDKARLRARLSGSMIQPGRGLSGQTLAAGPNANLKLAHLKHGGDYYVGRNYGGLAQLADFLKANAGLTVEVAEDVDPAAAAGYDLVWLNGRKGLTLTENARAGLKAYLAGGGFLVAESVMGGEKFNQGFAALAEQLGLASKPLPTSHELLTGNLGAATGTNVAEKVRFSRALTVQRVGRDFASLTGLYLGDRLVGVHSPVDLLYSLTGCPAWGRLGYEPDHAMAVAANLVLKVSAAARATPPDSSE